MIYDRIHSQIGVDCIILYVMIEALHLPHTLIVSSPYTYIVQFSTSYCGYRSSGCPCLIFTLYDLRVDVVGAEGGGLSVGTYD